MAQTLELKILFNADTTNAQRVLETFKQSAQGIGASVKIDDGLGKPFESAAKSAKEAATATKNMGDAATQAATGAGSLADKFAKIGLQTAGITSMATNIQALSQPFVELDSGLRAIGTLGVKNFAEFGDAALELSRTFPDNAAVISNAVAEAVGSGIIKTNKAGKIAIDDAKGFAAQASSLALAGATDIGRATSGLASVMNSYGDSLDKYGDTTQKAAFVSDVLFNTYNLGVTSVGDLASNLSNVTGIAASAGIGIDQVGAAIATMTKQGKQTGVATTQIRALTTELLAGKDKLAPVLKQLQEDFKANNKNYDKNLTLQQNLKKGNITLQDVTKGIGEVAAKQGKEITQIFGSIEAAGAVISLSGENAKVAFEDLAGITKRGTVAEGVAVQADSIENRMKVLVNTVNSGFIAAFGALGDGATVAIGTIAKLAPTISAVTGIKQLIPEGTFTKAIDGVKGVIAANIAGSTSFAGFGTAARAAWAAVTGPVGLVIAGLAAVGAGLVLLYQNSETVRKFFDTTLPKGVEIFKAVGSSIGGAVSFIKSYTSSSKEQVSAALSVAEAEGAGLKTKRDAIQATITQKTESKKLVDEYIALGNNAQKTGLEQAKFNALGKEIAAVYPGLIDRTKDFSQNLGSLQNASKLSADALKGLNTQLENTDKQIAANRQRQLSIQADSARAAIDDIFKENFRTFTGGFKGQTEQLYNEVNSAINEVYGQKTAQNTESSIAKLEAIVGNSVQKLGIDPRIASQLIQQVQAFGKNRVKAIEFYEDEAVRKKQEAEEKNVADGIKALEALKQRFEQIKGDLAAGEGVTQVSRELKQLFREVAQAEKKGSIELADEVALQKEIQALLDSFKSAKGGKEKSVKEGEKLEDAFTAFLEKTNKQRVEAEAAALKLSSEARIKALEDEKAIVEKNELLTNQERLRQTIDIERKILAEKRTLADAAAKADSDKRLQTIGNDLQNLLEKSTGLSAKAISEFTNNTANLVPDKIAAFIGTTSKLNVAQIKAITDEIQNARKAIDGQTSEAAAKVTAEFDAQLAAINRRFQEQDLAAQLQDQLREITALVGSETQRRFQTEQATLQDKFRNEILQLNISEAQKIEVLKKFAEERKKIESDTGLTDDERRDALSDLAKQEQGVVEQRTMFEQTKLAITRQFTVKQQQLQLEQFKLTGTSGREQITALGQSLGVLTQGFENIGTTFKKRSDDFTTQKATLDKRLNDELAAVGNSFKKRKEIQKKYNEDVKKLNAEFGVAGTLSALKDVAADTFGSLAQSQAIAFKEATAGVTNFAQIGEGAFISLGITAGATIAQVAAQGGDVGKAVVKAAFDTLQALVPVIVGQISILAFGQPDSVTTFGATAAARIALMTALVQGALSIARAAAGFKEGGLVTGGNHDGQTGRLIRINEIAPEFVMNHRATAQNLTAFTEINRRNITVEEYVRQKEITRTPLETSYFVDESGKLTVGLRRIEQSINEQTEILESRLAAIEAQQERVATRFQSYKREDVRVHVEGTSELLNVQTRQKERSMRG